VKYAWMTEHRDSYPVAVMCDVLNVSTSGYYSSLDRPSSPRAKRHQRIQQAVRRVHAESHGLYGSHKIAEVLEDRDDLESACRNTVVVDLFARKVVGWSLSASLATELVCEALRRAIEARRPQGGQLLHHSDRGCQYTSDVYQQILRTLGIECSMSRTGCCYDNAAMERFFWSLKHEWTNHCSYADLEDARLSVFKYIETFYNSVRIHQTLGYRSPNQYEAEHAPAVAA
jgi:putative transposase